MTQCWLFHIWDKWQKPYTEEVIRNYLNGDKVPLTLVKQSRECSVCGKIQVRIIENG